MQPIQFGGLTIGRRHPLVLIAGPCVIESEAHADRHGARASATSRERAGVPVRLQGVVRQGEPDLGRVVPRPRARRKGCAILGARARGGRRPDPHRHPRAGAGRRRAAEVADVLQIPAFLSRQTDLLVAAARTGRVVNIKKGQFLAPADMRHAIDKVTAAGNTRVIVTERGFSFGYNNLVVDMRAFPMLRVARLPGRLRRDAQPAAAGRRRRRDAGQAEFIEPMASAGVAAGVDGVFLEVHERPARAKSDAQNALRLDLLEPLLERLVRIHAIAHERGRMNGTARRPRARPQGPPHRGGRDPRARRSPERRDGALRARRPAALRLPRPRHRHRHGQVRASSAARSRRRSRAPAPSACFLHPAEAIHGDLGAIREDDVVLALSHSGETEELLRLLESIRRIGARLIAMTGDPALDARAARPTSRSTAASPRKPAR